MSLIEGDVEKKEKILRLIKRFGPFVSILAYIAGIVYFCLLPHQMLIHGTYVSENALLPGLVNSDIHSSESLFSYYETLKSSYENKKEMDLDLIKSLFSSKIETYFQQFNVSNPFLKNFREFNQELYTRKGRNLYALSRAQRADGTESIVITAPLYVSTNKKEKQTPNLMGIYMLLVIAEISKMKPYWAKDLIFVVPEMSEVGMQAWINSYYDIQSEYIKSENLNRRGGSIQAALNLEFADSEANKIELKLEGPNGKLPNLDLFNTVIRVCRSVHFECSLEAERGTTAMASQDEYYGYRQQPRPYLDHLDGLENTLAMVFRQATGAPSSLHGFFLNHRIEALTFKGSKLLKSERTTKKSTPKQNLLKAIQVVEGTMRSVNNLLERFHQSFFFYLLPSSHYYISIGMYMPAFGLIVLPLLVQILTIWFSIFYKQAANESNKGETSLFLYNLFRMVLAKLFIASAFGLLLYFGTPYFVYFGKKLQLGARESLINCYIAIVVNILGSAILINLKMEPPEKKEENNAENNRIYLFETGEKLIRLLGLLGLTIFLGTLSLLNFSLAFLIALFYVPASIFVIQPFKNKLIKLVQMIFWLVATPIVYFFLLYCFHEYYYSNLDPSRFLSLFDSAFDKFYSLVIMNKISNIWTYDLVNLGLIPIWALFWFITFPKL